VRVAIKILLADDHKVVRQGLRALLEKEKEFEVVGEAENGREAVSKAIETKPDIVLLDVAMPDLNGLEAARQIKAKLPKAKVIALSAHENSSYVLGMIKSGASGYILKDVAFKEITDAIRMVAAGDFYLSQKVAGAVVDGFLQRGAAAGSKAIASLTEREREVLQLLAEGHSAREVADKLFVSVKTIEVHRWKLMRKLGLKNNAELIKFAIREGLTTL
jgi:two-component system response regulator NreC